MLNYEELDNKRFALFLFRVVNISYCRQTSQEDMQPRMMKYHIRHYLQMTETLVHPKTKQKIYDDTLLSHC